jgi:hypothetical protein
MKQLVAACRRCVVDDRLVGIPRLGLHSEVILGNWNNNESWSFLTSWYLPVLIYFSVVHLAACYKIV